MKHLGDICKINGGGIAPVDVVIGGSPCQDLSIAGKRQGLSGERSGLFIEQIRLIKEMHSKYGTNSPRYMVWENVPGALSSNKGEDFRVVLESIVNVKEPNAIIPEPPKSKWNNNGCIMGDGWSIAWRILDAQFWGVPQRRRRIALVADFGGHSAPEILFERKSVSGDSQESSKEREGTASHPQNSTDTAITMRIRDGVLGSNDEQYLFDARGNGDGKVCSTITGDHQNRITDYTTIVLNATNTSVRRLTPLECERLQGFPDNWTDISDFVTTDGKHKTSSDTVRYKALGNSIALPPWRYVLSKLCSQYNHPVTMGSLFDGIGGFPLIWEELNGEGSCLWASEIEEFPMAVTNYHFNRKEHQ